MYKRKSVGTYDTYEEVDEALLKHIENKQACRAACKKIRFVSTDIHAWHSSMISKDCHVLLSLKLTRLCVNHVHTRTSSRVLT